MKAKIEYEMKSGIKDVWEVIAGSMEQIDVLVKKNFSDVKVLSVKVE